MWRRRQLQYARPRRLSGRPYWHLGRWRPSSAARFAAGMVIRAGDGTNGIGIITDKGGQGPTTRAETVSRLPGARLWGGGGAQPQHVESSKPPEICNRLL